jgi:hypothetical protein
MSLVDNAVEPVGAGAVALARSGSSVARPKHAQPQYASHFLTIWQIIETVSSAYRGHSNVLLLPERVVRAVFLSEWMNEIDESIT